MVSDRSARTLYGLSPYADSVRTQTAHFVSYTSAYVPERCLMSAYSLRTRGFIRGSIPLSSTIKRLVRRGSGKAYGQKPKMYGHADRIGRRVLGSGKVPELLDCCVLTAYSWCMTTSENAQRDELAEIKARLEAATPGPWELASPRPDGRNMVQRRGYDLYGDEVSEMIIVDTNPSDAEFIAHSPADMAKLLAALEAVMVLAEQWRYKGEFGWGAWQEGHGPDPEGHVLDGASGDIRQAISEALA